MGSYRYPASLRTQDNAIDYLTERFGAPLELAIERAKTSSRKSRVTFEAGAAPSAESGGDAIEDFRKQIHFDTFYMAYVLHLAQYGKGNMPSSNLENL